MAETGEATGGDACRRPVLCIGDIHGYISKLQVVRSNLESLVGPDSFASALVIFLGDYCNCEPHTCAVIDFLLALPSLPSRTPGLPLSRMASPMAPLAYEKKTTTKWRFDIGCRKDFEQVFGTNKRFWLIPLYCDEDLRRMPALQGLEYPTKPDLDVQ